MWASKMKESKKGRRSRKREKRGMLARDKIKFTPSQ